MDNKETTEHVRYTSKCFN